MTKALMEAAKLYNDPRFLSKSEIRIIENKKRRQRIVRRQKMAIILVITLIIMMAMFGRKSLKLSAQNEDFQPKCKYYKVITVHSGDSVYEIADTYFDEYEYENLGAYISEICSINHLVDADKINAGESLIVPYYDLYK